MRLNLKMRILEVYGSQRNFAQALNKPEDWVSKVVLGIRDPDAADKRLIKIKLGTSDDEALFTNKIRS